MLITKLNLSIQQIDKQKKHEIKEIQDIVISSEYI